MISTPQKNAAKSIKLLIAALFSLTIFSSCDRYKDHYQEEGYYYFPDGEENSDKALQDKK